MRGNLLGAAWEQTNMGSIPACAGEPGLPPIPRARSWVYPRVCGGMAAPASAAIVAAGLSPRGRGNGLGALRAAGRGLSHRGFWHLYKAPDEDAGSVDDNIGAVDLKRNVDNWDIRQLSF